MKSISAVINHVIWQIQNAYLVTAYVYFDQRQQRNTLFGKCHFAYLNKNDTFFKRKCVFA